MVSVWAYAYEMDANSLVDDATFDETMRRIDKTVRTGNDKLDDFFSSDDFDPSSGQFIYSHPDLKKVKEVYERYCKEV